MSVVYFSFSQSISFRFVSATCRRAPRRMGTTNISANDLSFVVKAIVSSLGALASHAWFFFFPSCPFFFILDWMRTSVIANRRGHTR